MYTIPLRIIGETFGIQGVNSRKLRSTAAHQMVSVGVHMNIISEFLRHKDKATVPRHYNIELVREAMNSLQFEGNPDATEE